MGFCRRCGDIVIGMRCKCGGTAVAPVLQWSSSNCQDKWSQTYISKDNSPTRTPMQIDSTFPASHSNVAQTGPGIIPDQSAPHPPTARRPSSCGLAPSSLSSRTTSQISSANSPPSLSRLSLSISERSPPASPLEAEAGISHTQSAPELSKAFGSILQPKESLAPYACAICLAEFQPDATIYPNPSSPESFDRFLCRPCFVISGGSKGDCPVCRRPVLILKSEGGFVETSGRVWHKKCFRCEGCQKHIGNTPMVDLLGKPSCADCFDTCLKRSSTPRKSHPLPQADNWTPATLHRDLKSREGSPAIDELEQRLGIMKNREGSPVLEELTQRLNAVLNRTPRDSFPSTPSSSSPLNRDQENSPLAPRILERKKSMTFISRRESDPGEVLTGGPLNETRSVAARQEIDTDDRIARLTARPSFDAVEEMKSRFMNPVTSSPAVSFSDPIRPPVSIPNVTATDTSVPTPSRIPRMSRVTSPGLRHALSSSSLGSSRMSWAPSTPDLVSDISDTLTHSSGPSSPPVFSPQVHPRDELRSNLRGNTQSKDVGLESHASGMVTPKRRDSLSKSSIPTALLSSGSLCAKCGGSLFATGGSGRFVTVPERSATGPPKTYHTECFRCALCDGPFRETANGQAVFVRGEGGACHIECAPAEKTQTKSTVASSPAKSALSDPTLSPPLIPLTNTIQTLSKPAAGSHIHPSQSPSHHGNNLYSSSRYERPAPSAPSTSTSSRFGSSSACPGCHKAVSPMEMGVVPGPQGSRWHAICLVCGGKGMGKGRRDKLQPGCGKRLDSAAKRDSQGGVWCRECLLLLPSHMRNPQVESSPRPLAPSYTGRSAGGGSAITPQLTGTTTIARQFTGRGGGDSGILRQLTGGGTSSARQLSGSPTKQLGLATPRPRPKSVIGMRSSKSTDEGRGMYLVRQMTGGGGSFGL